MSLRFALLGLLDYRGPLTGYELTRILQRTPTLFWQASHSQIYPELAKCLRLGLVEAEKVPQREKPDKKVYSVTSSGREDLRKWLNRGEKDEAVRDEFLLKIYLSRDLPMVQLIARVNERRGMHEKRLRTYQERERSILDSTNGSVGSDPLALREYLIVRRAILEERAGISWCTWVMGFLGRQGGSSPAPVFPEPIGPQPVR